MTATTRGKRHALVSTDGHAGASLLGYREYLEARWHEEFDRWASAFDDDAWSDIDDEEEFQSGASSFMSPVNWDSGLRQAALEKEGIVAEVLFPNTIQPFYPTGTLAAAPPRAREDYERRWAGLRAHNRWLKDFCDELPGQRIGLAQPFLNDVDNAVEEVRWAKQAGLKGVLLPPDHHLNIQNLYYRSLDPLWAVCAELNMPVHRHGIIVSSDEDGPRSRAGAQAVGLYESFYFGRRGLSQLILSGAFERHPDLQFVVTEVGGAAWTVPELATLDQLVRAAGVENTIRRQLIGDAVDQLSLLPSEYFRRQVHISTGFHRDDVPKRHEIGIDRILWGADFPHHEGTAGYTLEWLRASMSGLPESEVRAITSLNAADVYDADLEFLQTQADRVGPTVEQVATPLAVEDIPTDPNFFLAFPELLETVGMR